MVSNQERGLTLYIQRSLVMFRDNPKLGLEIAMRLNEEVHNSFQMEEFLRGLNEKLFSGKGEVQPLKHSHILKPSGQKEAQTRFSRLFSIKASLSSVISIAELWVKRSDLNLGGRDPFQDLVIGVHQAVDTENEFYRISIEGTLHYRYRHRNTDTGDWDGKPARLSKVSNGRLLTFSFSSIPPPEEISRTLFEQAEEVLGELSVHGLIPTKDGKD